MLCPNYTIMKYLITQALLSACCLPVLLFAQTPAEQDSLYVLEMESGGLRPKVLHAEPLYIDLIRDLGARKGEKEWNVGLGLTDNQVFDTYEALVEYEWAPVDRLGLEVELPFTFHFPIEEGMSAPGSRLNSLKMAAQYTFLVSEEKSTSMALGYIHEFELPEFSMYGSTSMLKGHIFNPFLVMAKRWGTHYHTLLYTGPVLEAINGMDMHQSWQANFNFHYMITGTRNFIGVEFNQEFKRGDFDMVIRPQMRVGLADNLLVGIVAGIPVERENQRLSTFIRLIYEPGHRH